MLTQEDYFRHVLAALGSKGLAVEQGLSDQEVAAAESRYEFMFPPDLSVMLQLGLPVSDEFPNWRTGFITRPIIQWEGFVAVVRGRRLQSIEDQMDWPAHGICFDIEHADFWLDEWGQRPEDLNTAFEVAREKLNAVPKLIPVYSHRFIPSAPCTSGNPVFSVYQTDVIVYGADLASYLATEFDLDPPDWAAKEPRQIRFWSGLANL